MTWKAAIVIAVWMLALPGLLTACGWSDEGEGLQNMAPAAGIVVPPPAHVNVFASETEDTARIVLTWSQPPAVRTSLDGRALLLRFDRVFEAPLLPALPRRLARWIQTVNATHDTILIRIALDVRVDVTVSGREVTLDLTATPPEPGETVIIGG